MINKKVYFTKDKKVNILTGLNKLADAVSSTLGPAGKSVIIEKDNGLYHITRDGVTVAKSIRVKDKLENAIIQIVKKVAQKTSDEVGDGTTTSTVLASSIINESHAQQMYDNNINMTLVNQGINEAIINVKSEIEKYKKEIKSLDDIKNIALVSSNQDQEVSKMITDAFDQIGFDGIITAEKSKTNKTKLEIVDGLKFERGYLSPYFVNNKNNMSVELKDCKILLCDEALNNADKYFITLLETVIAKNMPLLIIANDVSSSALATLIVNKARGTLNSCAVKAPEFGKKRELMFEDLAALTGATVITKKKGLALKNITLDMLGSAKNIVVKNNSTTIIDGNSDKEKLEERLKEINNSIESAEFTVEKEFHQMRLSKMTSGIAVISVGGDTEIEISERKDRVEDAIYATKAAIDKGIISGGGVVLKRIGQERLENPTVIKLTDVEIGHKIVYNAIQEPFNIIVENSGENKDVIWSKIKDSKNKNLGYNVITKKFVDMLKVGIIDPTKVTLVALDKAKSIASTLINTNCIIVDDEEDEKNKKPDMDMTAMY